MVSITVQNWTFCGYKRTEKNYWAPCRVGLQCCATRQPDGQVLPGIQVILASDTGVSKTTSFHSWLPKKSEYM